MPKKEFLPHSNPLDEGYDYHILLLKPPFKGVFPVELATTAI
jgi:hypothetical protein